MARAVARGEIAPPDDIVTRARIVTAMVTYRAIIERKIVDLPFLTGMLDKVLLPARPTKRPTPPADG